MKELQKYLPPKTFNTTNFMIMTKNGKKCKFTKFSVDNVFIFESLTEVINVVLDLNLALN